MTKIQLLMTNDEANLRCFTNAFQMSFTINDDFSILLLFLLSRLLLQIKFSRDDPTKRITSQMIFSLKSRPSKFNSELSFSSLESLKFKSVCSSFYFSLLQIEYRVNSNEKPCKFIHCFLFRITNLCKKIFSLPYLISKRRILRHVFSISPSFHRNLYTPNSAEEISPFF
jgi:hypothetical protein